MTQYLEIDPKLWPTNKEAIGPKLGGFAAGFGRGGWRASALGLGTGNSMAGIPQQVQMMQVANPRGPAERHVVGKICSVCNQNKDTNKFLAVRRGGGFDDD